MSDNPIQAPYCFPKIVGVRLLAFDLYRRRPDVEMKMDCAVLCLVGANGLGKSSFLNTLIYGLTGGLPYRSRSFSSPREYAEEVTRLERREDYYGGRLSEVARDHAAVIVELAWRDKKAAVTRQLFGAGAVLKLEVEAGDGTVQTTSTDADDAYKALVMAECGIPDFDQFIFLLHYVCAFDEDRHLLLWDSIALTNALYLAFGSDGTQGARANDLKRDVERFGSRARNSRFAARQSFDEADQLQRALRGDEHGKGTDEATLESYRSLNARLDEAVRRVHQKDVEVRKSEAIVSDRSAALTELQIEYDETFTARADGSSVTNHHPLVRSTIQSDSCALCATEGVAERVRSLLKANICPLCGSGIEETIDNAEALDRLRTLDQRIEEVRAELTESLDRRRRLKDEYETSVQTEDTARGARAAFLRANPDAKRYDRPETDPTKINTAIARLLTEAERFDMQSKTEYAKRDLARTELLKLEGELQRLFDESSDRFTQMFRAYAEAFIGLTVDIELEHRKGKNETGFELLLSLEDQARSRADAVSESQRFFLDIALRMALTEYMSAPTATLLIDTPEGSLDITYEARAGDMFSTFAERGNAILMTSNLRSSALLLRLAERQGRHGMTVERMTEWTDFSEVQRKEERLFYETYSEIEKALG